MTQEKFAEKLGISRQAVSNWENDRNLPDIEMLISIALVFHVSLDDLILGGISMNNMTEKLIQDGSETKRAKYNLKSICIGSALLILGLILFAIKVRLPVYLDATGRLHEDYFILFPASFLLLLSAVFIFAIIGIRNVVALLNTKDKQARKTHIILASVSWAIVFVFVILFVLLILSNS